MREMNKSHEKAILAGQLNKERDYWLKKLSGDWVKSRFPYDHEKNPQESYIESFRFQLTGDIFSRLLKLSSQSDIRLHMIIVSALVLLLHRYTSSHDIVVASPVLRQEEDFEFINTVLILRNELKPNMTFKEFLLQIRQTIIEATENQNYPIQTLPDQLDISFSQGEDFPLAEVAILLENIHDKKDIKPIAPKVIFSFLRTTGSIESTVEYKTGFYSQVTMQQIVDHFKYLLANAIGNVDQEIESIEILSEAEKKQLLIDFNTTGENDTPAGKQIQQIVDEQVLKTPHHTALIYKDKQVTYAYLNSQANRLAHYLKSKAIGNVSITAILTERSLEMIIGILAILKTGSAYLPIEPASPGEKISFMLEDSAAEILISNIEWNQTWVKNKRNILAVDITNPSCCSDDASIPKYVTGASDSAYIIYTSGTTGKPKGVIVEHRQAVNTLVYRKKEYRMDPAVTSLQLFSYVFDGFVTSLFTPLIAGAKTILLPESGVMDITQIRGAITRQCVTHFISVPSLYKAIIESLTWSEVAHLKVVTLAGDKLFSSILELSKSKNPYIEIVNEYGVTEAAVLSTIYRNQEKDPQIKAGHPISNTRIYVLDRQNRLAPTGCPGEICITGVGTARGYLNNPEQTFNKFRVNGIPGVKNEKQMEPLYRTGDMGRWLPDGNIELLGRMDYQVKIRGFRIEPGEIENRLLNCPGIKEAVVITKENDTGDKILLAFFVPSRALEISTIREYLSGSLPGYMIPAYFVELEQMPLTPTGKIDRKKLLQLSSDIKSEIDYLPPQNTIEEKLVQIWQDLLKLEKVGVNDNFFNIGGDSIKTIGLLNSVNKEFKTDLKTVDLYENDTIRKVAEKIVNYHYTEVDENREKIMLEIATLKDSILKKDKITKNIEDIYPLSDIEKGMIFYYLKNPEAFIYHNQVVFQWKIPEFDENLFRKTLDLLVEKHAILRSGYSIYDFEKPVHIVFKNISCDIEYLDITQMNRTGQTEYILDTVKKDKEHRFIFDGETPLWRMKAFNLGNENVLFLWSCHHAMIDGWSAATLMTELNNTYIKLKTGENVHPAKLKNTYKEFVIEQMAGKSNLQTSLYWKNELDGYKRLQLPIQHINNPRKELFKSYFKYFKPEHLEKISKAARAYNTSVKHLCFAAYIYMLNMLTYDNDIVVGLVTNNRPVCEDSEKIIGCFLNTVPVRIQIPGGINCLNYIDKIEKKMVALKKYDSLSLFEIKKIIGEENQKENPIFDTLFNYIDFHVFGQLEKIDTQQDEKISPVEERQTLLEGGVSINTLFDLHITTTGGQFVLKLTYAAHNMSDEWVMKLAGYYETILDKLVETPGAVVGKEQIITPEEKRILLSQLNNNQMEGIPGKTIDMMFEKKAREVQDNIAVSHRNKQFTYRELDEKSNQLAQLLREKNVEVDSVVGIMVGRSVEMIIGILAILKTGGAYLPIDIKYPGERKKYMVEDSGVKILLTNYPANTIGLVLDNVEIINISNEKLYTNKKKWHSPNAGSETSLIYVIYTSGSTGKPKGVMLEHRNLVNLMEFQFKYTNIDCSRILQFATISFDASFHEIFSALLSGGMLCMVNEETRTNIIELLKVVEVNKIRTMFLPMSMLKILFSKKNYIKNIPKCLTHIQTAGEQVIISDTFKKYLKEKKVYLHNHYGPSETHVVTTLTIAPNEKIPTLPSIGKPIANTDIYILDMNKCLLPVGVAGELYIGGSQVGRGYLGKVELTKEKFLANPFKTGQKIYKSGDLSRWLPDGNIEFLGRIDTQIKIRGFRVEPEEIESQLLNHKEIREAVVILKENKAKDKYLCAYIVTRDQVENNLTGTELRQYLLQTLPEYMIPAYFIHINKIPLTPNGKIDRKALPEPEIKVSKDYKAPGSEIEKKLAEIWARVLELEINVIGIESNFFAMGGNSLNLITLIGEINKEFSIDIPFTYIIDNPGLKDLANFVTKKNFSEQPVVLLNWKRGKIIFGFPDQNGFGYGYASLGFLLDDYSLYSLSYIDDEDRINQYINIITGLQPVGPYVFFGHSAAGKLAFVVAAALENRGFEVSDIIFADCFFNENKRIEETEEYMALFRKGVEEFLKKLNSEFLLEKIFVKAQNYLKFWNNIVKLEKVNANVHLILSEEIQQIAPNYSELLCWEKLTNKNFRAYNGKGTHRGMLGGKALENNVEIIKKILSEIEFGKN